MAQEVKKIIRKDWMSKFNLVGKPILNDYTFKIDERSGKSNWIYNALSLNIDCGEAYGKVQTELMGGYSAENANVIYAHGKDENGNDDFESQIVVDWDDRFNEEILEQIGSTSFITVGLEKTDKGQTFYKDFLSAYDAIAYIKKHLTTDMVVSVRGNLKYSTYNDNTQVKKNITYIGLSVDKKTNEPTTPDKFKATFTQSILIDKDSASLKNIDKDKGVMYIDAKVLDYVKELNGVEIKGQYPFNKQFEFELDLTNQAQCKAIMDKVFKVKKGVTQITFEGNLIEGGATVIPTLDDIPQEIKELIAIGVYTEEDALNKCASNGSRERRMVLTRPVIRLVGEEKTPVVCIYPERYTEEDLILDYLYEDTNAIKDNEVPFDVESETDDSMSWLNQL